MISQSTIELSDDSFEQEVLKSEGPVLVDFHADWCPPCKALDPTIDALAEANVGVVKVAKLNIDDAPGTAKAYEITSIPTLLLFKDGRPVERFVGLTDELVLQEALTRHAA